MYKVGIYLRVRKACFVEGMSVREAARVFGLHRDTVRKMLEYSVPPGYRRQRPARRRQPGGVGGEAARGEMVQPVRDAIRLGAVSFDAVKHLVLCRIEGRPPRLDMELYPYLPRTNVATTSTRDYMALLAGSRS